jgi:ribosome biogenesis GTPase
LGRFERSIYKHLEEKRRWHERREARAAEGETIGNIPEATVAAVLGAICEIVVDGGRRRIRTRGRAVAPGDRVLYSRHGVEHILPRRTVLARYTGSGRGERVLAANIDAVVLVASFGNPPLRPGLIDRYLIAIARGGAQPLICVNKSDQSTAQERALIAPYEALEIPVLLCSAHTGEGLEDLRRQLAAKLCVFTGHSGVGKSSLLNALSPRLALETAEVSGATGKGRHTTTAASLHEIGDGIRVIDTPGIREFGVQPLPADEVAEFAAYAPLCRFRDCTHTHEPECAVKAAVASGRIPEIRYEAYRKLAAL